MSSGNLDYVNINRSPLGRGYSSLVQHLSGNLKDLSSSTGPEKKIEHKRYPLDQRKK